MANLHADRQVIDLERAIARLGGDRALLRDLAEFFVADVPPLLTVLEQSLSSEVLSEATRAAHSIKGLAGTFDALALVAVSSSIEEHCRRGELDEARKRFGELQTEVQTALAAIEREVLN